MNRPIVLFESWYSFPLALLSACLLLLSVSVANVSADDELPLLGEHGAINVQAEVKLGKGIYDQLLERGLIETNSLLDRYISDLGARLLSALDGRDRDYRFFIVRDDSINAFALPGGYIGVNVGLILKARTQHQLASVMAHEIAHVRLRHGMKLLEKSRSTGNAVLLTILAGLLAGGGTELGAALVYGGTAGGQQTMINYTRDFEYEADRLGINLLQSAGFDGRGMVEFFQILGRLSSDSGPGSIEYLRTHPVSDNRVSEAESRLSRRELGSSGPDYFGLFQDYLMYTVSDGALPANGQYREALSKIKVGEEVEASKMLRALYDGQNDNFWYGYAFAESLLMLGKKSEAERVYKQMLKIYPDDYIISLQLLRLLKEKRQLDEALSIARRLENRYPRNRLVFFELVDLYRLLDQGLMEMIAQADYHRLSGSQELAIKLYKRILESPGLDLATESKVREKLTRLQR